jgi:hypothetical protein
MSWYLAEERRSEEQARSKSRPVSVHREEGFMVDRGVVWSIQCDRECVCVRDGRVMTRRNDKASE